MIGDMMCKKLCSSINKYHILEKNNELREKYKIYSNLIVKDNMDVFNNRTNVSYFYANGDESCKNYSVLIIKQGKNSYVYFVPNTLPNLKLGKNLNYKIVNTISGTVIRELYYKDCCIGGQNELQNYKLINNLKGFSELKKLKDIKDFLKYSFVNILFEDTFSKDSCIRTINDYSVTTNTLLIDCKIGTGRKSNVVKGYIIKNIKPYIYSAHMSESKTEIILEMYKSMRDKKRLGLKKFFIIASIVVLLFIAFGSAVGTVSFAPIYKTDGLVKYMVNYIMHVGIFLLLFLIIIRVLCSFWQDIITIKIGNVKFDEDILIDEMSKNLLKDKVLIISDLELVDEVTKLEIFRICRKLELKLEKHPSLEEFKIILIDDLEKNKSCKFKKLDKPTKVSIYYDTFTVGKRNKIISEGDRALLGRGAKLDKNGTVVKISNKWHIDNEILSRKYIKIGSSEYIKKPVFHYAEDFTYFKTEMLNKMKLLDEIIVNKSEVLSCNTFSECKKVIMFKKNEDKN